ncbi:sulfite exporter TauE/SafE family protein [Leptothoe spongobia]|uniref:sulfite exporter TauE/SafE family protein n=1 Tax=Leptothoe spongobia TaxID=2651728 RepID=UPI001C01E050|nr:sulfite exporter TauE/SafE family protein [Leptothoe spongobia]
MLLGSQQAFGYLLNQWQVALTMVFGSMIAGGTSIGGGAVAFPVFTKLLQISPHDAKVFSLAIQAVGMSAATLVIWSTGIRVEERVIRWGSLGGSLGIVLGLRCFAPWLPPDAVKMVFTILLSSFAITLVALNRRHSLRHLTIPIWGTQQRGLIFLMGLMGGIMSGLVGNGIDIVLFSVMVLLFRISEKVATPTSVILMAINALIGLILQVFVFHDFSVQVQSYWFAAIPVVVVGAPLGVMICSLLRRETIAHILISLIAIELTTSLLLIPLRPTVIYTSLITFILFSTLNYWMYRTQTYAIPFQKPIYTWKET